MSDFYLPRAIDDELDSLVELPAILIDGPKAVGKTVTARRRARTVWSLDDSAQRSILEADPTLLAGDPPTVLVDEWHRLPVCWDAVRRAVDDDPSPGRFLLTGSAPTGPTHSGAARIVQVRMRPMTLTERLGHGGTISTGDLLKGVAQPGGTSSFKLTDYVAEIVGGGFPGMRELSTRSRQRQLDGYLDRIVDRDLPEFGIQVRRPHAVMAWLQAYAAATSTNASFETIRKAAVRGDTPPAKTTVQPYIDLLTRLRILDQINGWQPTRNHFKRLSSSPKHHLADPALAARLLKVTAQSLLRGDTGAVEVIRDGQLLGALFESLATLSVRTFAQAHNCTTFHLRNRNGTREIDLIVQDDAERVLGIEVKLSATVNDDDVRHLLWLRNQSPDSVIDLVVLNTGPRAYRRPDGVAVIPLVLLGP